MKTVTAEEISAQLSEAVHEHRLKPGVKLREDEVGEVFGVSRTIVRQALRNMAFGGLLTIEKNRGAYVSKPTLREAHEVFQARALLEPSTARAAAWRRQSGASTAAARLTKNQCTPSSKGASTGRCEAVLIAFNRRPGDVTSLMRPMECAI